MTESVAVKISPRARLATQGIVLTSVRTPCLDGLFRGQNSGDPAELTIGQLHQAMAGCKLLENFAFNHERVRPGYIDEYGGQIFVQGSLRCLVNCHRYGPSVYPPALKCIETGEGQQGATPVLRLKCHHGHLRFLV